MADTSPASPAWRFPDSRSGLQNRHESVRFRPSPLPVSCGFPHGYGIPWQPSYRAVIRPSPPKTARYRCGLRQTFDKRAAACPLFHKLVCPRCAHLRRLTGGALGLTRSTGISLVWFGLGNLLPGAPVPGPRGGRLIAAAGALRTRIVAVISPRSHPSDPRIRPAQPSTSHHSPPIFLAE
jgi:hypothetical protein